MKLLITTLTMIFISYGTNAKSITLGELYKQCKIYQNNGFTFKKLEGMDMFQSILCVKTFNTLFNEGEYLCVALKNEHQRKPNSKSLSNIAKMRANSSPKDTSQGIMTFINYAEKHPKRWDKAYQFFRHEFMSYEYPCDYKKPL